jgi:hypothetical protein
MGTRRHDPHPPEMELGAAIGASIDAIWRLVLRVLARAGVLTP